MKGFDVISIGDSTEDVFVGLDGDSKHCHLDTKRCLLCVTYSDKIPLKSVHKLVGGNASNSAIGSSRLGLKSAFYSVVGNDGPGKKVLEDLKESKVNTKYFKLDKKTETNYSIILNVGADRTILVYHVERKYKLPKFDKSKWVYLSSMGKGWERITPGLLKYLKKNKVKLGFNPGTHQIRSGLKKLKSLMKVCDLFIVNKEEAMEVLNSKKDDLKYLLKGIHKNGCKIVVITDGINGSYCYDGEKFYFLGIFPAKKVERTGTGDAYSTGFLAALVYGKKIEEAMKWGTANSANVLEHMGPHEGLLSLRKMKRKLSKVKRYKVKEF